MADARKAADGSRALHLEMFDRFRPPTPKVWLIEGLLAAGELSVVYGAPSSGKSLLLGDMAIHVAAGHPWHGFGVTEGPVVYVAAERAPVVKRRLQAVGKKLGVASPSLAVCEDDLDLCDAGDAHRLIQAIRELEAQLNERVLWVIIDTKARVLGGGNTNDPGVIARFVAGCAALQKALGAHVTVIDHCPNGGPTRMKGDNGLAAAADTSLLVQKNGTAVAVRTGSKQPNDASSTIRFHCLVEDYELTSTEGDAIQTATIARVVCGGRRGPGAPHVLSNQSLRALEVLRPLASDCPDVAIARWRQACEEQKISSGGPEGQRKAFDRAVQRLIQAGFIHVSDHLVTLSQQVEAS